MIKIELLAFALVLATTIVIGVMDYKGIINTDAKITITPASNSGCPAGTTPSCWTDTKTLVMHCTCGGFGGGLPNGR